MAAQEIDFTNGDFRVVTKGLGKTLRAMEKAGADSQDMKELMFQLGTLVVRAADPPVLTGRMAGTIRAGKGKTKAVVRAGGARAPYAPVTHYGWPARNIKPQPFLLQALQSERSDILSQLDQGIDDILRKNDLK